MRSQAKFTFPVRQFDGKEWAELSLLGKKHTFVGTYHKMLSDQLSFIGQHRVRKISLEDKVHWLLTPEIMRFDISGVAPAQNPTTAQSFRRHHK